MAKGKHSADGGSDFFENISIKKGRDGYLEDKNYFEEDDDYYDDDYDYDDDNSLKIKIICIVIAIILIIVVAVLVTRKESDTELENVIENEVIEEVVMDDTYEGYSVLGKIKIDKIGVEKYILDSTEEEALKKGVTK